MKVYKMPLAGVLLLDLEVFRDHRGFLYESYQRPRFVEAGIADDFVQDNVSFSRRGVLRGLHFQNPRSQAKLISVLEGQVFDVAVDVRMGSPSFGKWTSVVLTGGKARQFYIPGGFAHGFCVLSERALVAYKCSDLHAPAAARTVAWDDPEIGIDWPLPHPILSTTDAAAPRLAAIAADQLPRHAGS